MYVCMDIEIARKGAGQKLKDKGTFISVSIKGTHKKPSYSQNLLPAQYPSTRYRTLCWAEKNAGGK